MDEARIDAFIAHHQLPGSYRELIRGELRTLLRWITARLPQERCFLLGINGAQGTGKSTLADLISLSLGSAGTQVVVLSLDDFYLTRAERQTLARDRHPLLATRGVPGTHDIGLLGDTLRALRALGRGQSQCLPVFDKASDERLPADCWRTVTGPVDMVILEGWCVATPAQDAAALATPVNALERTRDSDGRWRHFVNAQLREHYTPVFAMLDALLFLQAPDFDIVGRWRWQQECQLAATHRGDGLMDHPALADFLQHFERLTRIALAELPSRADVVIEFDREHGVAASHYR